MTKTINPTVQEFYDRAREDYIRASKELEKALGAIHREGVFPSHPGSVRHKLDEERLGVTRKCVVGEGKLEIEFYIQTGLFSDDNLGEVFLTANKMGSLESGLMDVLATLMSYCLQYGVPLEKLITKFKYVKFEPAGMTRNAELPMVDSIVDYLVKWLELKYIKEKEDGESGEAV